MVRKPKILPCPGCLLRDRNYKAVSDVTKRKLDRMLSMVCNTWPPGTVPSPDIEECCCGHPWLETAQEDYERWLQGETDDERQERRGYPTIAEWREQQDD